MTRNVQEYLACSDDAAFEAQKQRELQMFEATIDKMKQVCFLVIGLVDEMKGVRFRCSVLLSNKDLKKMKFVDYNEIISRLLMSHSRSMVLYKMPMSIYMKEKISSINEVQFFIFNRSKNSSSR